MNKLLIKYLFYWNGKILHKSNKKYAIFEYHLPHTANCPTSFAINYKNGKKHGKGNSYDVDGTKKYIVNYIRGKLV